MSVVCDACGMALNGDEKFCGGCGAALSLPTASESVVHDSAPVGAAPLGPKVPNIRSADSRQIGILKTLAVSSSVLSFSAFAADIIAASNASAISQFVGERVPYSVGYDTREMLYMLAPGITMVALCMLFSGLGAQVVSRSSSALPYSLLTITVGGFLTALLTIFLVVGFVNEFHYFVPRMDRDIVPVVLATLVAGLFLAASLQWLTRKSIKS